MKIRLHHLFATLVTLAGLSAALTASAQDFPTRPISIVVPFPAGGTTDIVARSIADKMRVALNQSVVAENKPGAASLLALNYVRSKPADGYTIVMVSTTVTTLPSLNASANYSIAKDFTSIAGIGRIPQLLVVHKDTGIETLAGLIAYAKANPGKLNWGVASNLGFDHLAALRIMYQAGIKIETIAYQGDAPLRTDLQANRVQVAAGAPGLFMAQVNAGTVRPLAVTSAARWPDVPNVPTIGEAGMKDAVIEAWFGTFGPAGMPANVVNILNREINAAIQTPDVMARLAAIGFQPMILSPAQMTDLAVSSEQSWGQVIKAMGIKPQ